MCKKRNNRAGSQPSATKIAEDTRITRVRVRGGNSKYRALRLQKGHFRFISTGNFRTAGLIQVVYHPSSNELVRTNTLTKSSVVKIAAEPFAEDMKAVDAKVDPALFENFEKGHLYAIITSRPGQMGAAHGHVLQGAELAFYADKFNKKTKEQK